MHDAHVLSNKVGVVSCSRLYVIYFTSPIAIEIQRITRQKNCCFEDLGGFSD